MHDSRFPNRTRTQSGFSLLEVLVAMTLMEIALVGILGLYGRSFVDSLWSSELGEVTSMAKSRMEELYALPFDSLQLTIAADEKERLTLEGWLEEEGRWVLAAELPEAYEPRYSRQTRVRQFSIDALETGGPEFEPDERLPGTASRSSVHIKEIEVRVLRGGGGKLRRGRRRTVTLRLLMAV